MNLLHEVHLSLHTQIWPKEMDRKNSFSYIPYTIYTVIHSVSSSRSQGPENPACSHPICDRRPLMLVGVFDCSSTPIRHHFLRYSTHVQHLHDLCESATYYMEITDKGMKINNSKNKRDKKHYSDALCDLVVLWTAHERFSNPSPRIVAKTSPRTNKLALDHINTHPRVHYANSRPTIFSETHCASK